MIYFTIILTWFFLRSLSKHAETIIFWKHGNVLQLCSGGTVGMVLTCSGECLKLDCMQRDFINKISTARQLHVMQSIIVSCTQYSTMRQVNDPAYSLVWEHLYNYFKVFTGHIDNCAYWLKHYETCYTPNYKISGY